MGLGADDIARSLEARGIEAVVVSELGDGLLALSSRSFSAVVCPTDLVGVVTGATRTPVIGVGDVKSRFAALSGGATAFAPATDDAAPAAAQAVALVEFARRVTPPPPPTVRSLPSAECIFRASFSCVAAETLLSVFALEGRTARLCVTLDGRIHTDLYVVDGAAVGALWNGAFVPAETVVRLWMSRRDATLTAYPFRDAWPGKGKEALDVLVARLAKQIDEGSRDAA